MICGEILKIINFYHFDSDPRFPPFLLYVRWKSGVTFVWRCFRDELISNKLIHFVILDVCNFGLKTEVRFWLYIKPIDMIIF